MLCTRCQQREAVVRGPDAEDRAEMEELFGASWPFPEDICKECLDELAQDPAYKERLEAFTEAAGAKARALLDKKLRATALKVLDFADRLAGKSGSTG